MLCEKVEKEILKTDQSGFKSSSRYITLVKIYILFFLSINEDNSYVKIFICLFVHL